MKIVVVTMAVSLPSEGCTLVGTGVMSWVPRMPGWSGELLCDIKKRPDVDEPTARQGAFKEVAEMAKRTLLWASIQQH